VGDHQASLLGSGLKESDVHINIATGSQVSIISHELKYGEYETRPYFGGDYILCDSDLPSGRDISTLAEGLGLNNSSDNVLNDIDKTVLRLFNDRYETITIDFKKLRGKKDGYIKTLLSKGYKADVIIYSAIKSIVEKAYNSACAMINIKNVQNIVLSGGLAHNVPALSDLAEAVFNKRCIITHKKEEALFGLATLSKSLN
jgi:hypothetical protein